MRAFVLPTRPIDDALALARRYRDTDALRAHALERAALIVPLLLLACAVAFACAVGSLVFFAERGLALLGIVLLPFVLAGGILVQAYALFRWIEDRALEHALGHRPAGSPRIPPLPWGSAAVLLAVPLVLLGASFPLAALALAALVVAAPFAYDRLDAGRGG